jgi:large subunit ribosomal protein L10
MPSRDKKEKVKQIKKWFDKSESLLVLHYKGLSVSEANELRVALSGMDCELRVVKNTLTRIALADSPKEGMTPLIDGPVAVAFVNENPAAVAKVIRDFGKGREEFYLRGGLLEGRVLDGKQV